MTESMYEKVLRKLEDVWFIAQGNSSSDEQRDRALGAIALSIMAMFEPELAAEYDKGFTDGVEHVEMLQRTAS